MSALGPRAHRFALIGEAYHANGKRDCRPIGPVPTTRSSLRIQLLGHTNVWRADGSGVEGLSIRFLDNPSDFQLSAVSCHRWATNFSTTAMNTNLLIDDQVSTSQYLLYRLGAVPIAGEQERVAIPECITDGVARPWFAVVRHRHL